MTTTVRAMVFDGPGRPLRSLEMPFPSLQVGEMLVKVDLCTICASDLHTFTGRRAVQTPLILGHEMVGTLVEQAAPANDLRIGDRIVWSLAASCGGCFFCTHDLPQKCEKLLKYGHHSLTSHPALSGGLATHCHLMPGTAVLRVPAKLPNEVVCPASCATATIAAVARHVGTFAQAAVVILGAGMLGLTAAAWARHAGALAVVVFDPDHRRAELAQTFGATVTIHEPGALGDAIRSVSAGRGADVVLELSGQASAIEMGMDLLRVGGHFLWVGAVFPTRAVSLLPEMVVRKHLTIQGIHNYQPRDLAAALAFLDTLPDNRPFAELVQKTFTLDRTNDAFAFALEDKPLRVAVRQ